MAAQEGQGQQKSSQVVESLAQSKVAAESVPRVGHRYPQRLGVDGPGIPLFDDQVEQELPLDRLLRARVVVDARMAQPYNRRRHDLRRDLERATLSRFSRVILVGTCEIEQEKAHKPRVSP